MDEVEVIIPTYKPDKKLLFPFLEELKTKFNHILVIDDGNGVEYKELFESIKKMGIKVVKHNKNYGKGRALKTGYQCALHKGYKYTVACDCDAQHSAKDVYRCAEELLKNPDALVIGVRDFDSESVPKANRIGNKITRFIAWAFIDLKLKDTQSGLRAMGKTLMEDFINLWGDHFDFEMNMLIESKIDKRHIIEVPIDTIYINGNMSSHFKVIKDSWSVYKRFLTYVVPALLFLVLDVYMYARLPLSILSRALLPMLICIGLYYDIHDKYFYNMRWYYYLMVLLAVSMVSITYFVNTIVPVTVIMKLCIDILIMGLYSYLKHLCCHNNS